MSFHRPEGRPPSVGLIGVRGYGATYVHELDRLAGLNRARFVACADMVAPAGAEAEVISRLGTHFFTDWRHMLFGPGAFDIVVIAAPIHLHAEMCLAAFASNANVLVEKPPVVSLEDFEGLVAGSERNGVLCQVGFQSCGSLGLRRLRGLVAKAELGEPVRLVATGQWQRDRAYWSRSEWAGKEALGGALVRDGAFSNPFAHAVMNCLWAVGAGVGDAVRAVDIERYRANRIEVEDTGCMRVELVNGAEFVVAVTLCAEGTEAPALHVRGPRGTVAWKYEGDALSFVADGRCWEEYFDRRSLLEELLAVVAGHVGSGHLSCPLGRTRPFVEVVEAVHSTPLWDVPAEYIRWEGEGDGTRAIIVGVEAAIRRAHGTGELFSELGIPWAMRSA